MRIRGKVLSLPVCLALALFGMGSWIDINGLWVELPLLVQRLPEGWDLPSYLSVIIQLANIGPIAFTIGTLMWPQKIRETPVIFVILGIGAASSLLLAFFWSETSYVAGAEHSTVLLALAFMLAFVDCTSSVAFLTFMSAFKDGYMVPFYIGEGLSGLVPSLVALIQGVGEYNCVNQSTVNVTTNETKWSVGPQYSSVLFPVEDFFYFLTAMLVTSVLAFALLTFHPYLKKGLVRNCYEVEQTPSENTNSASLKLGGQDSPATQATPSSSTQLLSNYLTKNSLVVLLLLTAWINCLGNGALPSIETYAALPYGQLAYSLAVKLASAANPLACFVALFVCTRSVLVVSAMAALGTALAAFMFVCAAMSPNPPLHSETGGLVIIVLVFIFQKALFSYIKVAIASILSRERGKSALLWYGAITQAGSFVGAIVLFILVNVLKVFTSAPQCQ